MPRIFQYWYQYRSWMKTNIDIVKLNILLQYVAQQYIDLYPCSWRYKSLRWLWRTIDHELIKKSVTYKYFRDIEVYQFKNDMINFTRSAVSYPSGHFDYFYGVSPLFAVDGNFCSKSVVWWRFHIYNNYYWCKVKIIFEWSRLIWCWW